MSAETRGPREERMLAVGSGLGTTLCVRGGENEIL